MSEIHLPDPTSWSGAVLVSDLGVIQAQGDEAAAFLHGQLSQDVNSQTATQARLAAYCSAKGRMLGSLLNLRPQPDRLWLLADRDTVPALVKRLSMFVLRAKAKLTDVSDSVSVLGIVGTSASSALGAALDTAPWSVQSVADGQLVRLPDVLGVPRWLWVGEAAAAQACAAKVPALPLEQWQWLDVMSGIPRVQQATVDQFVPQMINFELIGGVNFQKGCYPGQEVVARSQYRGTTKRRAFIVHASEALAPGQELFSEADPGQPAGVVINAAPIPGVAPHSSALVELKLAARGTALRAGSAEGMPVQLGALPYSLPTDDASE
ncbi:MAG: folate-binding protein [Aquabacterium sp.]|jgi:folate-binding protein YgfZ|uniref:CAF17-like 4Fe-4S cluster assembly/insertion protein YgfZ n=1 Tax=Aquabacterium sp. TaxID=1872578 RepID=UPI002A368478|nr:folate-binding protein [Aquabacterium sp.]MDX9842202.1 folate-binding protein [Aquabacterium sp.]